MRWGIALLVKLHPRSSFCISSILWMLNLALQRIIGGGELRLGSNVVSITFSC